MTFDPKEARALVERLDGYTRGPWKYAPDEEEDYPAFCVTGGGFDICTVWHGYNASDADMHLIAAAPVLHAALTAALAEIERLRVMAYQPASRHPENCDCGQCVPF